MDSGTVATALVAIGIDPFAGRNKQVVDLQHQVGGIDSCARASIGVGYCCTGKGHICGDDRHVDCWRRLAAAQLVGQ